jgi:hypothetical protein
MFLNFHKIQKVGSLPNSIHEASVTLTPKLDKANYGHIFLMNIDAKILNKYLQTKLISTLKRSYTCEVDFIPGMHGQFNI